MIHSLWNRVMSQLFFLVCGWHSRSMSITVRVSALFTAAALTGAAALAITAGAQTLADVPVSGPVASPVVAVAAVADIPAEVPVAAADSVEGRLVSVTDQHLNDMGHYRDAGAETTAAEWAGQVTAGQVEFFGGIGRGVTDLEVGDGNIYRLSTEEAEARIAWLSQPVNVTAEGTGYGVASASVDDTIYLVEYFLY